MYAMPSLVIVALTALTLSDAAVLSKVASWIRNVQSGSALGIIIHYRELIRLSTDLVDDLHKDLEVACFRENITFSNSSDPNLQQSAEIG